VTYDDGILVLETPQSPQVSRDVIRTIHERHPNQRIRWAVPTRHHFDHSGGLFRYIEDGATVVTTEGNADFVRRVAQAPRTIGRLDRRAAPAPRIEVFAERRAFGEGTRRVELIDVGPNPHADEILIAFPELKTLFVADLYGLSRYRGAGQPECTSVCRTTGRTQPGIRHRYFGSRPARLRNSSGNRFVWVGTRTKRAKSSYRQRDESARRLGRAPLGSPSLRIGN
jgi:hypothetical protein